VKTRILLLSFIILTGCGTRESVVVYSSHSADMLGNYERLFESAHPNMDVQWRHMPAEDAYRRIQEERAAPAADLWWGGPSSLFQRAAGEGLLETYRPSWAEQVPEAYKDPEGLWHVIFLSPIAIVFNMRKWSSADVPQTWDELLQPQWSGRILLCNPASSDVMRMFLYAMILRAPSEEAGFAWLKALHAATRGYPENPTFLFEHMNRREDLFSVWLQSDVMLQRERNGLPLDCIVPPDTLLISEGIGIVANAPHRDSAEKFYEFVTSENTLAHQAHVYAKRPARKDIDTALLPEWMRESSLLSMNMDENTLEAKGQEWYARWARDIFQAK